MNQIMSWMCLISVCFLALQVMIYICEDTLKVFNSTISKKKKAAKTVVVSSFENKIAK